MAGSRSHSTIADFAEPARPYSLSKSAVFVLRGGKYTPVNLRKLAYIFREIIAFRVQIDLYGPYRTSGTLAY